MSIVVTWVRDRRPLCRAVDDAQAGLVGMTRSLATEWGRYGIRLNAVAPGEIPTEGMSKRLNPGTEAGARTRR